MKARKLSVLLTTHYLEEANHFCQRVCIINKGKVVATGTPADLKMQLTGDMYVLRVRFKLGIRVDGLDLPLVPEIGELGAVFREAESLLIPKRISKFGQGSEKPTSERRG